eukprot:CAMPEP_0194597450 /NCGR_PEP_ID=MMETSP0292-20121207/26342_1 /TAXON_ID=39354 /ORGANISM="Heterosigma akashiwo, Strain CCMP2393" /LENGTH=167 /DNA_ID=CAMNT_0039458065 /DNA_START=131 /DNA_END=630 /DNA_ORIENTATION=+
MDCQNDKIEEQISTKEEQIREGMNQVGMKYINDKAGLREYLSSLQLLPDEHLPYLLALDDFDLYHIEDQEMVPSSSSGFSGNLHKEARAIAKTLALLDHAAAFIWGRTRHHLKVLTTFSSQFGDDPVIKNVMKRWVPAGMTLRPLNNQYTVTLTYCTENIKISTATT